MQKMIEVPAYEASNYGQILTLLGMEEEGDPVAEVERLRNDLARLQSLRHELKTAQEGWRCECSTDDACRFARERDAKAERIAELEQMLQNGSEIIAGLFARAVHKDTEIEALRAQLAEIAAAEPYAYEFGNSLWHADNQRITSAEKMGKPLFTHPMPAQDVTELAELREWRDKTFEAYPNIDLDIEALSKYKGAK